MKIRPSTALVVSVNGSIRKSWKKVWLMSVTNANCFTTVGDASATSALIADFFFVCVMRII
ncbi:MAG: hypothetical protein [Inoviridae sp.]|nr:MAG: hypothetical protein [Inoviridae sp.]